MQLQCRLQGGRGFKPLGVLLSPVRARHRDFHQLRKCPFRLWRGAHSERMLKATSKHPCRKAVQRAAKLREMLANLPPSKRGDHAKRDARRWVQSSFVFKVKPFTRVAKAGTATSWVQPFLLLCP